MRSRETLERVSRRRAKRADHCIVIHARHLTDITSPGENPNTATMVAACPDPAKGIGSSGRLFHILRFPAMRPGIVGPKENNPLVHWRVVEVPPTNKDRRRRIGEIIFGIFLES